jgi:hypothetical protein
VDLETHVKRRTVRSLRFTAAPCAIFATCVWIASCSSSTGGAANDAGVVGPDASAAGSDDMASDASAAGSDAMGSDAGMPPPVTPDDGPNHCNSAGLSDAGMCAAVVPTSTTIIGSTYSANGSSITYGVAPDLWDVYTLAGPGQTAPTLTPSAGSLAVSANVTASGAGQAWVAVGVSADGADCVDTADLQGTGSSGIMFQLAGDLGGCGLVVAQLTGPDESTASDPCRGMCAGDAGACVAPSYQLSPKEMMGGQIFSPNMSFGGGSPEEAPESKLVIGYQWRLVAPGGDAGTSCSANIMISNVQLIVP